jgi:hypothetical protein
MIFFRMFWCEAIAFYFCNWKIHDTHEALDQFKAFWTNPEYTSIHANLACPLGQPLYTYLYFVLFSLHISAECTHVVRCFDD